MKTSQNIEHFPDSQDLYRRLVESSPDAIILTDLEGRLILANRSAVQLLELQSLEDGPGLEVSRFIVEEQREEIMQALRNLVARASCEPELVTLHGRRFPAEVSVAPVMDTQGKPAGFTAVIRDISERKQREREQEAATAQIAALLHSLETSHQGLLLAYDRTLEGWALALELRDRETEGHTRHAAEKTVELGRIFGMSEEELVNVRRGVLLHDIGKLAVPDRILLKPGPLDEEEWQVMRMHPTYAREMIEKVPYLRTAIDIPYCHHERWDGSGYPQGISGEAIPLPARIFAVIDVWDALTSNRPYRPAWPQAQAREYLRQQAGRAFDPKVVEVFLNTI